MEYGMEEGFLYHRIVYISKKYLDGDKSYNNGIIGPGHCGG
jgi:hypothetical protein